jgi:dihydroorotate dehydrogenase
MHLKQFGFGLGSHLSAWSSCAVKTVELKKSIGNEQPWHFDVENRSQINAPSRERNGDHHFYIH